MCILNIILNFVLAFKTPLGYLGIGVATVVSVGVATLLNLFAMRSLFRRRKFNFTALKSMFNIGWPIGILQVLWSLAVVVIFTILGNLPHNSVEIIAAYTNGLKIESAIFLPAFAFNLANAVVVGNLLGKQRKQEAFGTGFITASLGTVFITFLALTVILNARFIMPFLSSSRIVIENGLTYLYISMMFEPIMAWGVILSGALVGAGYTKNVLAGVILGAWVARVPLCYFMGIAWQGEALGVWWAINISIVIQSIFLTWCYVKKMRPKVATDIIENK